MLNDFLLKLKPWLAWLHLHPEWASIAVFFVAFIECLAVVGLLVPGTVIMTVFGVLIGSAVISAKIIFIPAALGALLGDIVSFLIGRHYREHLREIWPFKFYPRLLEKGESFFYKHGGKGVFAGRFLGPIRPMLPIIAGMLNMPKWRFFAADSISAIFWAPVYMLPGIILGAASVELAPDVAMHIMLYAILILLGLWCISWLIKRFIAWMFKTLHDALDDIWAAIKHKPLLHPLHIALQDPLHPESHAQLTLGLYFIFMTGLFLLVAGNVLTQGTLTLWNHPLFFFLRSLRNPVSDHIFIVITLLSEPKVWLGVFAIILAWFTLIKAYRTAFHWGLLGLLSVGCASLFKHTIHSLRPWGLASIPSGYSFPSGHVTLSGAILGFLSVLIARELPKSYRWIPYTLTVIIVLAVAASRLYLGAHWLTDALGAMLLALTIVMFVTLSYRRHETRHLNLVGLISVFLCAWGIMGGIYATKHYQKALNNYTMYIPAKILSAKAWWDTEGIDEPLYRLNRTGKPAQVLNVQWAGNLHHIERTLVAKGWEVSPNTALGAILNRMNKTTKKVETPVIPQLYLDQRPVLMMTKTIDKNSLLILTLWDSKTRFSDSELPLWLGNISYFHIWETGYFHLHPPLVVLPALPPISVLEKDLSAYAWKQLSYPLSSQKDFAKLKWDGQVVLLKPEPGENG